MSSQRYLCSHLMALRSISGESAVNLVANLEEIHGKTGAVLESEEPVKEGTSIEIRCGAAFFAGRIVRTEAHEFGWRLEMEFSPLTPWSLEQFQPEHLLNVSERNRPDRGLRS